MRQSAFLRAVNVGRRLVPMERLRQLFSALGLEDVATVVASGNVVFSAARGGAPLARRIEARLEAALGFEVPVFLRTGAELAAALAWQPFGEEEVRSAHGLSLGFLDEPPDAGAARRVEGLAGGSVLLAVLGREVHWLRRDASPESLDWPARIEKELGVPITFRNVTTVRKVAALVSSPPSPRAPSARPRRGRAASRGASSSRS